MPRDTIPDWKDMPEDVTLSTFTWHDLFIKACDGLGRDPTHSEIIELFDTVADRMSDGMGEQFSDTLDSIMGMELESMLEQKRYDVSSLCKAELTSKKYCHECNEVQKTYWELNHCKKNPKGIDLFSCDEHGNDGTCEDAHCSPESTPVESKDINPKYLKEHSVYERCVQCHQYFDSAGPQGPQEKEDGK